MLPVLHQSLDEGVHATQATSKLCVVRSWCSLACMDTIKFFFPLPHFHFYSLLHSPLPYVLPTVLYPFWQSPTSVCPSSQSLLIQYSFNTYTHPLSFFSLLMLSFSCCSFSSISLLSWARVTVSICSSCRFLWKDTAIKKQQ